MSERFETLLERAIFHSRWLLAPFYIALVACIVALFIGLLHELGVLFDSVIRQEGSLIIAVLNVVDITLVANLLIIVIFSGYENFISRLDIAHNSVDKPSWMGKVTYSDLKLKLIGSIVAISAIELLKDFVNIRSTTREELAWLMGLHAMFLLSGVLFALMDKLASSTHRH